MCIYIGRSVSSAETDIDTRQAKALTAIGRLSVIWKSDLTDKIKRSFFQAAVVSILLYGCTTWTLTKRIEKMLDGIHTRMLRAILNKSLRQHPTKQQLCYGTCIRYKIYSISFKKHSCPKTELRKILTENTILEPQNDKQKLEILEALHIRNIPPKLNRINFQTSANLLKCL